HQARVARSCLCFSLFAPLLLCPESSEPQSLRFLALAPRFRLGCGFRPALLLRLRGSSQPLFFSLFSLSSSFRLGCGFAFLLRLPGRLLLFFTLLSLGLCFRLGCGFRFALLLCLSGSEALLFSLLSRIRLHCPWQRYWHACRE